MIVLFDDNLYYKINMWFTSEMYIHAGLYDCNQWNIDIHCHNKLYILL